MERKLLTVKQFGELTGVSSTTIYRKTITGEIPTVRIGRGVRIPNWYFERLVAEPGVLPAFLTRSMEEINNG